MDEIQRKLKDVRHDLDELADQRIGDGRNTTEILRELASRLGNVWYLICEERRATNTPTSLAKKIDEEIARLEKMKHEAYQSENWSFGNEFAQRADQLRQVLHWIQRH